MTPTAYDQVRYPGKFYPQSSADRLCVTGRLHGLQPAVPAACRLLELGCGDGGNLIPQAALLPQSHFVGVDLSSAAVADGRARIAELGLRNVELIAADIATFDPGPQPFDYIVAHGVLSWVPLPVRERLLALCGSHLAPQGVAYLSYSALPGAYLRSVPRDLMRFHTRRLTDPAAKTRAAREVIDFMMAAQPSPSIGRELLEREMAGFEGKDYFLLHDLLADDNEPLYFLDLVDAAAGVGLQFLSEAELSWSSPTHLPPAVQRQLEQVADRLEREQYLDFLTLRRFRQTLLCRRDAAVDTRFDASRLQGLHLCTRARPAPGSGTPHDTRPLELVHPQRGLFRAEDPLAKALAIALAQAEPQGTPFEALHRAAAAAMGREFPLPEEQATALARLAIVLHTRDMVEIHAQRGDFTPRVAPRPAVAVLTRLLAAASAPVVNAMFSTFYLPTEAMRRLVLLLDGTRTHDELLETLAGQTPAAEQEALTPAALQRRLQLLADNALLLD